MNSPDLERAIDAYFREGLSEDEEAKLFAVLASDEKAMDRFVELAELESGLVEYYGEREGQTRAQERIEGKHTPLPARRRTPLPRLAKGRRAARAKSSPTPAIVYVLPAAAVLIAVAIAFVSMDHDQPRRVARPQPSTEAASAPRVTVTVTDESAPRPETVAPVEPPETAPEVAAAPEPSAPAPVAEEAVAEVTSPPVRPKPAPVAPPVDEPVAAAEPPQPDEPPAPSTPQPARGGRIASVKSIDGTLERSPAGSQDWKPVAEGDAVATGDRLRTRFARAVLACETGTAVHIDRFTTMSVTAGAGRTLLSMVGGEVFVATSSNEKHLVVETKQGIVTHKGTRFAVSAKQRGTTIMVIDGSVEARTDAGVATVTAGHEVTLSHRASEPGAVVEMRDPRECLAWTGAFPPEKNLDADLVAYWSLDEGRGNVAYDRSPNGLHGRLTGRPQWVRGRRGIALAFDGTKGQGVDINRPRGVGALAQGTIMAWVKPAAKDTGHRAWFSATPNASDCYFKLLVSANAFEIWAIRCASKRHAGARAPLACPTGWNHVAMSVDGTSTTLYVNGKQAGRVEEPILFTQTCKVAARMRIGGMPGHPKLTFDGIIDDVRIYRRPLDASEVTQVAGIAE